MNSYEYKPAARSLLEVKGCRSHSWLPRGVDFFLAASVWLLFLVTPTALMAADDAVPFVIAPPALKGADGVGTNNPVSASDATNQVNVLDDKYRLAIGDQLSFKIIEDEEDPKILTITDSGDLQVPYIGRYPAVGKTCKELAADLKTALENTYYWHATVIIAVDSKPRSRGKIYISGAVGSAGPEDIFGDETMTVSKAVLRAGGLNSFANGREVRVWRNAESQPGHEKTYTIDVNKILEKGDTGDDMTLQPGDLIYVPERMIRF